VDKSAYVAGNATLIGDVTIGKDASIWYGVVLRGDMHYIRIGRNSSVQDNSVLHGTADMYPTVVGNNVSIGHNAIVHGCTIGDNCIVGMGAIILEGARIGDWCIIGAGAVVPEGMVIKSNSIVLGVPAKAVRKVTSGHKSRITRNWKAYVRLKDRYLKLR
jgi:carbonic anhydrase/acetyltransferase-like protein (isoleucine patch superfamily)